jgi:hypothetical protein
MTDAVGEEYSWHPRCPPALGDINAPFLAQGGTPEFPEWDLQFLTE